MSRVRLFAVIALVVLSGCTLPGGPDRFDTDRELGYIGDYAHDDVFEFDPSDGLTADQLEAVKYRTMARLEVVRGLKFERDVALEIVSRDEYRNQRADGIRNASAFENEVWRGAFVVDGDTDVNRAFDDLYGDSVQGYYVNDRIVIVTDETDEIRIDRWTLVHELTHALQDQHFGIGRQSETIDGVRAENGLFEGEANFLPDRYDRRCGDEWQCLPDAQPTATSEGLTDRPFNVGLFLSVYVPYAEGPEFAADLYDRGGWDAVDRAHDERPTSTAQLIHPDRYPDTDPVDVTVPDRSTDAWRPVADGGDPRTETVGEATLFATLWANGAVDRPITAGATERSPYNYSHPATAGWAGDAMTVYRSTDGSNRTGHAWRLAWESPSDAAEFTDAYRRLLANEGGQRVDDADSAAGTEAGTVYRIPDGEPFAGAYRVSITGETVTIVGAPTVDDLDAIHAHAGGSYANESAAALDPASAGDAESSPTAVAGPATPTSADPGTPRASADG
ncbi:Hvo_1808 family surface protein [Natrinema salifodinae]|uniref:Lipoprotein n=1 Tax=Natrinema salifodinae TaxID=1202768 RepID=A0A1I0Q2C8_9EURY|nr:Hvo_1808 family surface protein [Natrinema salifodinae]SEW21130.1 hypothetical protein SAMN05216285_2985 [Natrinema salifodinae]